MLLFEILLFFFFGASLGSFVNVIADRYNTGLAWWKGKSFCFSCNTKLNALDLVTIFSFLFLKGKCKYCQSKIAIDTFITEITMGALALLAASQAQIFNFQFSIFNFTYFFILLLIFAVILLITLYDLHHFIIPDSFLLILLALSVVYTQFFHHSIFQSFLSGVVLALPFLLLFLISRGRWLGLGDVKYIGVLGVLLGLPVGLSAVILAFWIGAAYALLALFVFKKNITMKSEIPFGPFLSLGIILGLYFNLDLFHLNDLFQIF